ncbi:MAG: hypothetical protein ACR2NA_03155 [Solirubrobacterales bacterium]
MTTTSMCPDTSLLLSRLASDRYDINGVPAADRAQARERAAALVQQLLSDLRLGGALSVSPLGAAWSTDVDVYLDQDIPTPRLEEAGWLPLDGLLARIGSPGRGRWLVMDGEDPLAIVHLHVGVPPEPVSAVLRRAHRRGEVRLREVLELLALSDEGQQLPADDPVVRVALRFPAGADAASLPIVLRSGVGRKLVRARAATGRLRRSLRPRLGVAISGVDGAGKSTLSQIVVDDLHRAGIPADRIWTRPGLRIGVLERVGIAVKHVLGEDPRPTVQRVAQGESPAMLRSRRGLAGWAWSFLVTCSFLIDVRRRQLAGRGILFYDRHVLDALATLRLAYGGVDTRLHEAVARRLLPNAFASFYLEVPADVARARKHDDVFGAYAIAHQLETYASALAVAGAGVHILDGLRPPRVLANDVLATLAEVAGAGVSRPRASARRSA